MLNFLESALTTLTPYLEKHWEIDHVCFRTDSLEHYTTTKQDFEQRAQLLIESPIGGRPIATYELDRPIWCQHGLVSLVEVPAPKTGRIVDRGYEHLEVVIDCDFQTLMTKYPELNFDDRAISKELNPELEAKFDNFNVKFHHHALNHVIEFEKDKRITAFLPSLKAFAIYTPLLSGTIPLGINVPGSDLDILMATDNFDQLAALIKQTYPSAQIKVTDHLVANLEFQGLPIEFYAKNRPVLEQNAHRHLRIEGRLLKLLGASFKAKIIELKRQGIKTEPAFGQLLELSSPYEELLELYYLSDRELLQRFESHCS